MTRKAFTVFIDLDLMDGDMHTVDSAQNILQHILDDRLASYNPYVSPALSDKDDEQIRLTEKLQKLKTAYELAKQPKFLEPTEADKNLKQNLHNLVEADLRAYADADVRATEELDKQLKAGDDSFDRRYVLKDIQATEKLFQANESNIESPFEMNPQFVDKYYVMDPETEKVLLGHQLRNGMKILSERVDVRMDVSDSIAAFGNDRVSERTHRWNRWMTISELQNDFDDRITFVGTYDDGTQKAFTEYKRDGWYVKLNSITAMPLRVRPADVWDAVQENSDKIDDLIDTLEPLVDFYKATTDAVKGFEDWFQTDYDAPQIDDLGRKTDITVHDEETYQKAFGALLKTMAGDHAAIALSDIMKAGVVLRELPVEPLSKIESDENPAEEPSDQMHLGDFPDSEAAEKAYQEAKRNDPTWSGGYSWTIGQMAWKDTLPTGPCPDHLERMYRWDGQSWVCPSCVIAKLPKEGVLPEPGENPAEDGGGQGEKGTNEDQEIIREKLARENNDGGVLAGESVEDAPIVSINPNPLLNQVVDSIGG